MAVDNATTLSEELAAMQKICEAMAALDGDAAGRVLQWSAQRFLGKDVAR